MGQFQLSSVKFAAYCAISLLTSIARADWDPEATMITPLIDIIERHSSNCPTPILKKENLPPSNFTLTNFTAEFTKKGDLLVSGFAVSPGYTQLFDTTVHEAEYAKSLAIAERKISGKPKDPGKYVQERYLQFEIEKRRGVALAATEEAKSEIKWVHKVRAFEEVISENHDLFSALVFDRNPENPTSRYLLDEIKGPFKNWDEYKKAVKAYLAKTDPQTTYQVLEAEDGIPYTQLKRRTLVAVKKSAATGKVALAPAGDVKWRTIFELNESSAKIFETNKDTEKTLETLGLSKNGGYRREIKVENRILQAMNRHPEYQHVLRSGIPVTKNLEYLSVFEIQTPSKIIGPAAPEAMAIQHPQFAARLAELHRHGFKVIVDPSLSLVTAGAMFSPGEQAVILAPTSTWLDLEHEFTHFIFHTSGAEALYSRYLERPTPENLKLFFSPEILADFKAKGLDVELLLKSAEKQLPTLAANEEQATTTEIKLLRNHYKTVLPKLGYSHMDAMIEIKRRYALNWQISTLSSIKEVNRTPLQAAALDEALAETMLLDTLAAKRARNAKLLAWGGAIGAAAGVGTGTYGIVSKTKAEPGPGPNNHSDDVDVYWNEKTNHYVLRKSDGSLQSISPKALAKDKKLREAIFDKFGGAKPNQ